MSRLQPRNADLAGRTNRRWRVLTGAAAVLTVISLLGGAKLVVMQVATARGIAAAERGDHEAAERAFRLNLVANWIDPWRTHFNLGVALYGQAKWPQAQEQFATAMRGAPGDKRCVVALNLAWSHEAEGDQHEELNDPVSALEAWKQAEEVASAADCPYDGKGDQDPEDDSDEDAAEPGDEDAQGEGEEGDSDGEDGENPSDSNDPNEGDGGDAGATDGSLAEQQQRTEQRVRGKAQDAEMQAEQQRASEGDPGESELSEDLRLDALDGANQRSQENRQRGAGMVEGDPGRPSGSDGPPTW